jgi:hypothetical protein
MVSLKCLSICQRAIHTKAHKSVAHCSQSKQGLAKERGQIEGIWLPETIVET